MPLSILFMGLKSGITTYWRPILFVVLAALYTYKVYHYGSAAADATWTSKYNQQVERQNTKIAGLESLSKTLGQSLDAKDKKLAVALNTIIVTAPKILPKTRQGQELKCGTEVIREVYLGPDFSSQWNKINEEANK